jgi:hypothetical protein
MWTKTLECGFIQLIPIVRMSNTYQQLGSFLKRFSKKIHCTIFSHNPSYTWTRGNDTCTFLQEWNNLILSLIGSRSKCNNVLPPSDILAPFTKSTCPPVPEKMRVPMESAQTCPVKSTSVAELIVVIFGFREMTKGSLV